MLPLISNDSTGAGASTISVSDGLSGGLTGMLGAEGAVGVPTIGAVSDGDAAGGAPWQAIAATKASPDMSAAAKPLLIFILLPRMS